MLSCSKCVKLIFVALLLFLFARVDEIVFIELSVFRETELLCRGKILRLIANLRTARFFVWSPPDINVIPVRMMKRANIPINQTLSKSMYQIRYGHVLNGAVVKIPVEIHHKTCRLACIKSLHSL